ncbi:MAG: CtsR family transcriptional regulator, partial [Finegoldia magna]|nr:CtsR family transcriptional regulator [Finegoldia magna]
ALEDNTLSKVDFNDRNILRADLLKNMLLAFMR